MQVDAMQAFAIFDMDGLLIDSEPLWLAAQKAQLLELYGLELPETELLAFQGTSTVEFCRTMEQRHRARGVQADTLLESMLQRMAASIDKAALMPGARELLEQLSRQSVVLAIASSSPMHFIEAVVRAHKLPVSVFASGIEVPRSKPHPAVFELAAARLGAEAPWQCRVWEDSVNGVIAAKAAGMVVVAVPDPAHPTPEKFSIADHIHSSLLDSLADYNRAAVQPDIV
ncbi:HAD family hydrolase [Marinobacterium rhizophilum]|uniref:HAD family hydrolase n=1 Tax=Marinobacterium rhizophilum TaxID=420402 RepID=UPI00037D10A6|nr:HAD family phosphatase [Marinobacterium rhizophilum]